MLTLLAFADLKKFALKIVHITEAFSGGIQTYLKNVSDFLIKNAGENVEVYIIYSGHRPLFNLKAAQEMFKGKATMIEIPMTTNIAPVKDFKGVIAIYKELKKIQPDVIHLHSSKAGILGRAAAFFFRKKNKSVFYTPHGYSFLRTDVSDKSRAMFRTIEKTAQRIFGGTTIACGDTEYELAQAFGKADLIRNGLEVTGNEIPCTDPDNSKLTVGIVSRITAARNPELFNTMALRFPDINFIWIGDGELRKELTAPNIVITGWLTNPEDVENYLCKLDVYIQTSLWEGLPYAVLEAMAKYKPVVATNVIGNKDIVVHGETGFLFTDIEELDKYFDILKDKNIRKLMGQKGYLRLYEEFNNSKNFKHLLDLYRHKA